MFPTSLFSHKELASIFLDVDHESLSRFYNETGATPEEVLAFLKEREAALTRWRNDVSTRYHDAFNRSGRVVDTALEKQNFSQLKKIYKSGIGLYAFLELLLKDGGGQRSVSDCGEKMREAKKELKDVQRDNADLVASLMAQYEEVRSNIQKAQGEVLEVSRMDSVDAPLQQTSQKTKELLQAIEREESMRAGLLAEIGSLDAEDVQFDEAIRQETSEIGLLKQMIEAQRENTFSQQEKRQRAIHQTEQTLKEMKWISSLLKKVGGTEIEGIAENQLILKLRTDVGCRDGATIHEHRFTHQLALELHPVTFLVQAVRLHPEEAIPLEMVIGESLTSAVMHLRSLLFIALNRKAHFERLQGYRFVAVDATRGIWRVALPNRTEVEILLPVDWPYEATLPFKLLEIQAPQASVNLSSVREKIQGMHITDLRSFLGAITQLVNETCA